MDNLQRLKDLAISDTGFVFDPYSGSTFSANTAGLAILEQLKEGSGRDQIAAALEEQFEVQDSHDLHRDIDEFLLLLRHNGLLPDAFDL